MKRTRKPVRKCHGCGLNLGDTCGKYEIPHDMWHHRSCPGYRNEEMLQEYLEEQAKHPSSATKGKRRVEAKTERTEDHHQGVQHKGRSVG